MAQGSPSISSRTQTERESIMTLKELSDTESYIEGRLDDNQSERKRTAYGRSQDLGWYAKKLAIEARRLRRLLELHGINPDTGEPKEQSQPRRWGQTNTET